MYEIEVFVVNGVVASDIIKNKTNMAIKYRLQCQKNTCAYACHIGTSE